MLTFPYSYGYAFIVMESKAFGSRLDLGDFWARPHTSPLENWEEAITLSLEKLNS